MGNSNSQVPYQDKKCFQMLHMLEQIIFDLNENNIGISIESTMNVFDYDYPFSSLLVICQLIYISFISSRNNFDLYQNYMKKFEENLNIYQPNVKYKIFKIFKQFLLKQESQESYYLLSILLEQNLADIEDVKGKETLYFAHYKSNNEIELLKFNTTFCMQFFENRKKLSNNNWELHKQYIKEGHNPNEIAKIIRNDEIEKLQEISSQTNFDFDQTIPKSIYERYSFVNEENVTLIDYAAFFSAVKCFKYLLMNGANVNNTGKYAIAGGNEEIIHLCEQNHSSFEDAYEAAIQFHRNDIFKYLYEKKNDNFFHKISLRSECINYFNYELFLFLPEENLGFDKYLIEQSFKIDNLFLVKNFLEGNQISSDTLFIVVKTINIELFKYIIEKKEININTKDAYGKTALMYSSINGKTENAIKILSKTDIQINTKDNVGKTALIYASEYNHFKIVKLLLAQKGIDINAKNKSDLS